MAEQKTIETFVDRTEEGTLEFDAHLMEEDRMILNMGPPNPSTHGVLRIILTLAVPNEFDPLLKGQHWKRQRAKQPGRQPG